MELSKKLGLGWILVGLVWLLIGASLSPFVFEGGYVIIGVGSILLAFFWMFHADVPETVQV